MMHALKILMDDLTTEYNAHLPSENELRNKLEYERARLEKQIKTKQKLN